MPLRLKGDAPRPGEADRRYYMIDVQEGNRRVRLSSGTRERNLAERREQAILDALRANPDISHADLQVIVRGATRAVQSGLLRTSGARTLKQACDEALADRRPWGKSRRGWAEAKSRDTYATNCRELQRRLGAAMPVAQIDQAKVDGLVEGLLNDGNSETTVNRKAFCLLSVMRREKERDDLLALIPKYMPFDESDNARGFELTIEQENQLFDKFLALDPLPPVWGTGGHPRKRDAHHYHDLFVVRVDVGCRLTAGLRIQWGDITWRAASSSSSGASSEQKGGKSRTTPLAARAAAVINRRRVLGGYGQFDGMTKRHAQHVWDQAKKRSSLASEREAVIHCLRHTCATRMLRATGDIKLVQEWLGHSAIQTTSDIYAKVMADHKISAMRAYEDRFVNVT